MQRGFLLHLFIVLLSVFVVFVPILQAQTPARSQLRWSVPVRVPPSLNDITRKAGIIFAGRVLSITPARGEAPGNAPTVRITFKVEEAIRGTRTGDQLTINEWAGLWAAGERYRVGDRAMLFLYPPSRLELTSPVGGAEGRMPIDRRGRVQLSPSLVQAARRANLRLAADASGRIAATDFARAIRRLAEE